MDGILIIDKPTGITSHDVVSRVRRILKIKRIGHTGTLDPFATGVMVILVGRATRLARFLDHDEKEYEAVVRLGFETDTGDRTGSPKSNVQSPNSATVEDVRAALDDFRGEIKQVPPMYSAKKIDGKKLYEHARKGATLDRKPITVRIYDLEIFGDSGGENFEPWTLDLGLRIRCSAGTYIRTLAEDIGRELKTGAHLTELRRTRAGKFDLSQSLPLDDLEKLDDPFERLIPMEEAVSHLPVFELSADRAAKTRSGLSTRIKGAKFEDGQAIRMLDEIGNLIAIGFYGDSESVIRPKVVLV
jgi:tRNA pseudouridine55 synthase